MVIIVIYDLILHRGICWKFADMCFLELTTVYTISLHMILHQGYTHNTPQIMLI